VKFIVDALESLRDHLILSIRNPGFLQLALPLDFPTSLSETLDEVLKTWESEFSLFLSTKSSKERKSVTKSSSAELQAFPFPRVPYSVDQVDPEFSKNVLVPVEGLCASYQTIVVPCNVLLHEDFYPGMFYYCSQ
jgi:hypothetical protein